MSIDEKEGRHGRSVRLTSSVNTRLINLCDHLGVTPNAYLVQAIGKAITQDEIHFKLGKSTDGIEQLMQNVSALLTSEALPLEKQLPLEKDI